jgi:hypothetical protein
MQQVTPDGSVLWELWSANSRLETYSQFVMKIFVTLVHLRSRFVLRLVP